MKIAILGGQLPYPANAGNRIRTLNLLTRLASRHELTFIHLADPGDPDLSEAVSFMNSRNIETIGIVHRLPSKHGFRFYARLAANLISPLHYSIASYTSREVGRAVTQLAAERNFDLWQIEALHLMEAIRGLGDVPKLLIAHNVEALVWQRYHAEERNRLKRWYIRMQWRKLLRNEREAFSIVDRVIAVSSEDRDYAREMYGADHVDVVDNGINRGFFEVVRPNREPNRVLFLGSLDWRPNQDALCLLLGEIFPLVLREIPTAQLTVVGRKPPAWLIREIGSSPNAELYADVPDVRPFLASSAVLAVPLRIGGGSRLKILESLATGLPVVSTRIGAEGLRLCPGRDFTLVESYQDMAAALVERLSDPEGSCRIGAAGRRVVLENYDWDALAMKLEESWINCASRRVQNPSEGIKRPQSQNMLDTGTR